MTINSCQYKVECDRIFCEVEPVGACTSYKAIENQQLAVALQTAEDCGYTRENAVWMAEFFRVPISRLERELE